VIAADTRATSGPIVADKVCNAEAGDRHVSNDENRIVKSSITLRPTSGVLVLVLLPTLNLLPPSPPPTLNFTHSPPGENLALQHA